MIFLGEPGQCVYSTLKHRAFRFNKDGKLEIKDKCLAKRFMRKFPVLQEAAAVLEETAEKIYTCKHCGAEFNNKGLWLAHLRKEHPKGKEEINDEN